MIQYHSCPFALQELKIEVTYRCTLNCIHCSSDSRPSNLIEMEQNDCTRILAEAAILGARQVAFSGGEPLFWRYICEAVSMAARSGFVITIYTSGNTDDFKAKAKHIYQMGAQRFIFSVFGGTATTHERVTRVVGSFDRTLSAMAYARALGLTVEIHFVPMATNYGELRDVALLGKNYGASVVSVLRLVNQGRAALLRSRTLNRVQNLQLRRQVLELRDNGYKIRTGSPYNFLMVNPTPECSAALDRLIIGPDLRLYPCDAFKQVKAEEIVGTLDRSCLNGTSLQACWEQSPYLEAIRRCLTAPFKDPCESCRSLGKCRSGCLAQKVVSHGTLASRPDPDCLGPNFQGD